MSLTTSASTIATRLNQRCFCVTLDRKVLEQTVDRETADSTFNLYLFNNRPNLLSNVPVFLSSLAIDQMHGIVEAIEATARLLDYRKTVLGWAPEASQSDSGPIGAFMGYDFHLDDSGAKLIEINTNAGGAVLNSLLAKAQKACCSEAERALMQIREKDFDTRVVDMFGSEWRLQRGAGVPRIIAIVDDRPVEQYLYPEFILTRDLLRKHGIEAVIGDANKLEYEGGKLQLDGQEIDLVYNRLVDFSFSLPAHAALAAAYRNGAVVVTPNPHNHAIYADKRNLTLLSDPLALKAFGLPEVLLARLVGIPKTTLVTSENAAALWRDRKNLFFKPVAGHGGKAVYRGDKVTKGVWAVITGGGYVAQIFAPPGERMIELDGELTPRKMDVRLYTYAGKTLLAAARLYHGQTTNFRTPGGGFAPVFAI